tara:strand:+ start:4493 stop:6550 length:2058 start_codon:yes stop_codon:yes gene_type:complete
MLVSDSIPNLLNGVSQQPATLRLPSQSETQVNALSSVVRGLLKRPPSEHIAKVLSSSLSNAAIHLVDRDSSNRYIIIITSDGSTSNIYAFDLTGASATVSTPVGTTYLNCTNPREDLKFLTVADYTFIVNKTKTVAMDASTSSGSIQDTVQQFSDLPSSTTVGHIYKVQGDDTNAFDDYYVKANTTDGVFEETIAPGVTFSLNDSTMPHALVLTSGSFSLNQQSYTDRVVGDLDSIPNPSFVGQEINDVFFYKNRLGFLSEENVVFSQASQFFNFFGTTVTDVLDDEPIDVAVSHNKVSVLNSANPFNESLVLFSDHTQFTVDTKGLLTPKTISITSTTEFENKSNVHPVAAGPRLYFAGERGNYSAIYEYFVDTDAITKDATETSGHVPRFIPKNITKLTASSNEDILFALSTDYANRLYVYKWHWSAGDTTVSRASKVQSSWSYWEFNSADTILDISVLENDLFMVVSRSDGVFIDKISLQTTEDTSLTYNIRLDRKTSLSGTYNAGTGKTTWTLPYVYDGTMKAVKSGSWTTQKGIDLNVTRPTTSTVEAVGDYSASAVIVGIPYTLEYTFSNQYVREEKAAVTSGRLQLRTFTLTYEDTTFFKIQVTPEFRSTYEYEFNGLFLNEGASVLDAVRLDDGTYRIPVQAKNDQVTIKVISDSHLPCAFQNAEWEGFYTLRSRRI